MREVLRLGIIGVGERGRRLLEFCLAPQPGVRITALCDVSWENLKKAEETLTKAGYEKPSVTRDYQELLSQPQVDAVIIAASWETHIAMACDAMRSHKYTAFEIGGAFSLEDCWKLVRVYEETGTPCMMLENCCYGRNELLVLNMVRQGLFGELVHCRGGYHHDLRAMVAGGYQDKNFRYLNLCHRNCEYYPTHELGPIANVLNINRGNRMLSLVSVASKSAGLYEYMEEKKILDFNDKRPRIAQGDIVTTVIKCAGGETIVLTLDTTLPRYYSRGFHVQGTKGMYEEENNSVFLDKMDEAHENVWEPFWGNAGKYYEEYDHPLWKRYVKNGIRGDHEGIDWLMCESFIRAAKSGAPAPIDIYDAASWMCITCLSEESIAMGGMPVAIPDFTGGKWLKREPWEP